MSSYVFYFTSPLQYIDLIDLRLEENGLKHLRIYEHLGNHISTFNIPNKYCPIFRICILIFILFDLILELYQD